MLLKKGQDSFELKGHSFPKVRYWDVTLYDNQGYVLSNIPDNDIVKNNDDSWNLLITNNAKMVQSQNKKNYLSPATKNWDGEERSIMIIRYYMPQINARGGGDLWNPLKDTLPTVIGLGIKPLTHCKLPWFNLHVSSEFSLYCTYAINY